MLTHETQEKNLIRLRGAREHNLKGLDIDFLRGKLTVICGVSGSGKTSLALDTLYAEGQRRYIESFSAYSRQFLQRIEKPRFDTLTNLPPSIATTREQRARNNRSTVGTASDILEYLRIVFAKNAELHCYRCQRKVTPHTPKTVLEFLCRELAGASSSRAIVGFQIEWRDKNELSSQLFDLQSNGFVRIISSGQTMHLADDSRETLARQFSDRGRAIVAVDRVRLGSGDQEQERISQSLATAFAHSDLNGRQSATVLVETTEHADDTIHVDKVAFREYRFSTEHRCEHCEQDYPTPEPRLFSFNSPIGACSACEGFGETVSIDMSKVVPDRSLTLEQGAIAPWRTAAYIHEQHELMALAAACDLPTDVPVDSLKAKHWKLIREGVPSHSFGGLNGFFEWLERKKYKMHVRAFLSRWRTFAKCEACDGKRLSAASLAYQMAGRSFAELCELTVQELHDVVLGWNDQSTLAQPKVNTDAVVRSSLESEKPIAGSDSDSSQRVSYGVSAQNFALAAEQKSQYIASEPMRQVESRLRYLIAAGLHYVALSRPLHTLSSGEAQRVVMTTLLGSSLVDMLYVFDEPTVGLHPRDTERMADAILGLRDRGNTVILIEHEPHLMRMADQIIEIGPDAGSAGGNLVFQGTPQEILAGQSLTGAYLNGSASTVRSRRPLDGRYLELRGASGRNLKSINCRIPLGCLTVVIGPSGAGKSTLVLDTLCPAVLSQLEDSPNESLPYESVLGTEQLSGCLSIDQSPIPRSIRSCPATYCKAMDDIRQVFSETSDAVSRGLGAGHFSFNNETGRCPTCQGLGYTTIDMQFMADLHLPCTDCDGKRFRPEVLEVRYRDQNIADVLSMSLSDAHAFFRGCHSLQQRLKPMLELGLGYLPLGQSLSDLSAGESMRLKLASHLEGRSSGTSRTEHGKLIVMDEPTTGLHFQDIDRLIRCVDVLIDQGNTVVVIEHNQQIISNADHIIELGPGAGDQGGTVIATGTAIELKTNPHSVTGRYL